MEKRVKERYGTWWGNPNICIINIPRQEKQQSKNYFRKLTKAIKLAIQEILWPLNKTNTKANHTQAHHDRTTESQS